MSFLLCHVRGLGRVVFSLSSFAWMWIDPCGRSGVRERPQEAQDRAAVRLRNDFEHRFHSLSILHRAYTCQGIYRQGAQATVSVGVRDAPSDAFLANLSHFW